MVKQEKGKELTEWAKTRIDPKDYKTFKKLAIDEEISVAELFKRIITAFLKEPKWQSQVILKAKAIE